MLKNNHKQKYLLIYNIRCYNKIKIKKYCTVGAVPKFNRKIDTPNTHIAYFPGLLQTLH